MARKLAKNMATYVQMVSYDSVPLALMMTWPTAPSMRYMEGGVAMVRSVGMGPRSPIMGK